MCDNVSRIYTVPPFCITAFLNKMSDHFFDGKLELTPSQEISLRRSFELYDKNRDGVLDYQEIEQVSGDPY